MGFLSKIFNKKKKINDIPENKVRIIKIGREALYEFIYENFIDNAEQYFDLEDITSVTEHFAMDWDEGTFIMALNKENVEDAVFLKFDMKKIMPKINETTDNMYKGGRYIEMDIDEFKRLENE